jgi:hypothetical protein
LVFVIGKVKLVESQVEFMGSKIEECLDVFLLGLKLFLRLVVFSHERSVHDGFLFVILLCFIG